MRRFELIVAAQGGAYLGAHLLQSVHGWIVMLFWEFYRLNWLQACMDPKIYPPLLLAVARKDLPDLKPVDFVPGFPRF